LVYLDDWVKKDAIVSCGGIGCVSRGGGDNVVFSGIAHAVGLVECSCPSQPMCAVCVFVGLATRVVIRAFSFL